MESHSFLTVLWIVLWTFWKQEIVGMFLAIVRTKITCICFIFQPNALRLLKTALNSLRNWIQTITETHTSLNTVSYGNFICTISWLNKCPLNYVQKNPLGSLFTVKLLWHIVVVKKIFDFKLIFHNKGETVFIWSEVRLLREGHRCFQTPSHQQVR